MENKDYYKKNSEVNYASKFKNDSDDAPKVIRGGAQSARPVYSVPPMQPPRPVQQDYYTYRETGRDSGAQLMYLQNEIVRLREELNRQNQRNDLRDEIARLKEELREKEPERRAPMSDSELSAAEREIGSLIAELKRETDAYRPEESREDVRSFADFSRTDSEPVPEPPSEPLTKEDAPSYPDEYAFLSARASETDLHELLEQIHSVKTELAEQFRTQTESLLEKLKETPAQESGESIFDTSSIMQSTLLDEIMELKKAVDENSVTKDDLSSSIDRVAERVKTYLDEKEASEKERQEYVSTQFSMLCEMLAYNFETNSGLIQETRQALEDRITALDANIGNSASAASELVIKLTQIISVLGIDLQEGQDVIGEVRKSLDARFSGNERLLSEEIERLNLRLSDVRASDPAASGLDLVVSLGFDRVAELLDGDKAKRIFDLKEIKDRLQTKTEADVPLLAQYIKGKALLLQDYDLLVADVKALKSIATTDPASEESLGKMRGILEVPANRLVDPGAVSERLAADRRTLEGDSAKILSRIESLQHDLKNLKQNHEALFEGIASSIREISAAVDGGAKAEDLERINERMEKSLPKMLSLLQSQIVEGIKDNVLDKNETKVRLENLSAELSKLTDFSEISSILYDFKREVEDTIEGNVHQFGAQVAGQVDQIASKVETSLENNEIAVEVAKLAQNVAVSPNFDQSAVLEEIEHLKHEITALRKTLSSDSDEKN